MEDITGKKFGKLTVIAFDKKQGTMAKWLCKCECGNVKSIRGDHLKRGEIRSCGCIAKANPLRQTRIYRLWMAMNCRCNSNNENTRKSYKDKGITVCEQWKKDFFAFYDWSINNGYADNLTLDRIDVNGNYCPENCRWTTRQVQSINTSKLFNPTTGIFWSKEMKKWEASLGKLKHLGYFDNIEDAIKCRQNAMTKYLEDIGFFNNTNKKE